MDAARAKATARNKADQGRLAAFRDTLRPTLPPLTAKQKHQRPRHYILRNF